MKLKRVAALCARTGTFYLYDEVDKDGVFRQWLGDGRACYPLSGLPALDVDNLCSMFDIPDKKRDKCFFCRETMPERLNVGDCASGERALDDEWPTVKYNGFVVKPLSTRDGISFIQAAYLSPLEDMGDYLRLFERVSSDGQTYIVAKNGMEIAAVIMPMDTIKLGFVEKLEDLARRCRTAVMAQEEREYLKSMNQEFGPLFRGDGSGGDGPEEGAGE